jgi:hypothetical protein
MNHHTLLNQIRTKRTAAAANPYQTNKMAIAVHPHPERLRRPLPILPDNHQTHETIRELFNRRAEIAFRLNTKKSTPADEMDYEKLTEKMAKLVAHNRGYQLEDMDENKAKGIFASVGDRGKTPELAAVIANYVWVLDELSDTWFGEDELTDTLLDDDEVDI